MTDNRNDGKQNRGDCGTSHPTPACTLSVETALNVEVVLDVADMLFRDAPVQHTPNCSRPAPWVVRGNDKSTDRAAYALATGGTQRGSREPLRKG